MPTQAHIVVSFALSDPDGNPISADERDRFHEEFLHAIRDRLLADGFSPEGVEIDAWQTTLLPEPR